MLRKLLPSNHSDQSLGRCSITVSQFNQSRYNDSTTDVRSSVIMTSSPSKQNALPGNQLASPRTAGRLRQMKSAHNLGTTYGTSGGTSLITQQRQQQQRNAAASKDPLIPPVPHLPSPQKYGRSRSNSDLVIPRNINAGASPRKNPAPQKAVNPRDELEALIRHGPGGNVTLALQNLRHWILCEGMDADGDGMVGHHSNALPIAC